MMPVAPCDACGADNDVSQRHCGSCGVGLPKVCLTCAAQVSPSQRFCGECGTAVASDAAVERPAPAGQRADEQLRWVSVLFIDLVDSTALAEDRDPADLRQLLADYFAAAKTVVTRYGGRVEKFIGDAVVAVWGTQTARVDDAQRAVRAGLEVVASVAEYGEGHGVSGLAARAGVVTGQVATWGDDEGLVAGDRVNTAARVQGLSEPGQVLVDDVTRRVSEAMIGYTRVGERMVKGKSAPILVWCADSVLADTDRQQFGGSQVGLVGRVRELGVVKELFHAVCEGGRARLMSIIGEAGVGKSRVGSQFSSYLDGSDVHVWWHEGRCPPYGEGVALWALRQLVQSRLGLFDDASNDVVLKAIDDELPRWLTDEQERGFVTPALAALFGVPAAREPTRQELFAGWRLFLERLAAIQPVVWLIDDLHWADAGLLDFVEYLMEWSADRPIFVLTLARPAIFERRPGWASEQRNATTLHLEPLPDSAMVRLLQALHADLPDSVVQRITERAAGLPLYAVEIVRSLQDQGVLTAGSAAPDGSIVELDVPSTLTALLVERLDALPAPERALVQGLAVLGASFPRRAVDAVVRTEEGMVDLVLQSLVDRQVLVVRRDPLSPENGHYTFVQSLLREVAYQSMPRRVRKERHLQVARQLAAQFANDGEEVAEVIAAHLGSAHLAAPPDEDADEIRLRAIEAYERAGRRAAALGAPATAQASYVAALDLAPAAPDRLRLLVAAGEVALLVGDFEAALPLLEDAARDAEGKDDAIRCTAVGLLGETLAQLGNLDEGIARIEAAITALTGTGRGEDIAVLHSYLADLQYFTGDHDKSLANSEQALALAEAHGRPHPLSRALAAKAYVLFARGRAMEAAALLSLSADITRQHQPSAEPIPLGNLSEFLLERDLPDAREKTVAAHELSRRYGDRYGETYCLGRLAFADLLVGDWDQAQLHGRKAVETSPNLLAAISARLALATLAAMRGDIEGVNEHVEAVDGVTDPERSADVCSGAGHPSDARLGRRRLREGARIRGHSRGGGASARRAQPGGEPADLATRRRGGDLDRPGGGGRRADRSRDRRAARPRAAVPSRRSLAPGWAGGSCTRGREPGRSHARPGGRRLQRFAVSVLGGPRPTRLGRVLGEWHTVLARHAHDSSRPW